MNNLKRLRKEIKLASRKLATYVSIPDSGLIYLENENRPFRQKHIEVLTSFFNVTADYLLGKSNTGYIVFFENENDPITLTEEEYYNLKPNIETSIIQTANIDSSFTLAGKTIYFPKYTVHRELKGDSSMYDFKDTLINKINNQLKSCDSKELSLVSKFIEEFIKKK